MEKYFVYFKCVLSEQLAFRFRFFLEYLSLLIISLVRIFIWLAIASSNKELNLNKSEIITYFILAFVFAQFSDVTLGLESKVRSGGLSNELIKPINIIGLEFTKILAQKVVVFFKIIPIFFLLLIFYFNDFKNVNFSIQGVIFLIIGMVISFYIQSIIQSFSFWITDTSSIGFIVTIVTTVFSGALIPYKFLSVGVQEFFKNMPFSFFVSLPIRCFTSSLTKEESLNNFILGIGYVLIFATINSLVFRRGIKKYVALGG